MIFVYIIIGIIVGAIGVFFFFRAQKRSDDPLHQNLQLLNQRLDAVGTSVNQAITDNMHKTIKMVLEQLENNRQSAERSTQAINQTVNKQVGEFASGLTQLRQEVKQVSESMKSVSSFQDIFKSPKLRGIWGEASLENALSQYFPKDAYELQHYFSSGEAVDAALRLPNGLLLPIDSKFNWENFEKMVNSDNDITRDQYRKTFFSDVKKKIDEIASKYLLPSEGTTDFALMYVPAETVYYEIINNIKDADVPAYARSKKIILTSPNTFFLSVSAISHWTKDVQLSKQTKEIMKRLERIATDGHKLGEDFRRLGKHLSDAHGSFEDSEKRLTLLTDRVENVIEIGEKEESDKLLN